MKHPQSTPMEAALCEAYAGIKKAEGGPFGCCIVKKNTVIATGHNTVLKNTDPTCHAEINAIKQAARKLKNHDLSDCVVYTTTEPCPMCFSAIHWAKIDRVIYGTSIADVKKLGFNELTISAKTMKRAGKSPVQITAGFMIKECRQLLAAWKTLPKKDVY